MSIWIIIICTLVILTVLFTYAILKRAKDADNLEREKFIEYQQQRYNERQEKRYPEEDDDSEYWNNKGG